jgi:hypothetical protein
MTASYAAIRRIAAAWASLDAEVMDEVEGNVQRHRNARLMATTEEQWCPTLTNLRRWIVCRRRGVVATRLPHGVGPC